MHDKQIQAFASKEKPTFVDIGTDIEGLSVAAEQPQPAANNSMQSVVKP